MPKLEECLRLAAALDLGLEELVLGSPDGDAPAARDQAREILRRDLSHLDYSRLWPRMEAISEEGDANRRRSRQEAEPLLEELLAEPSEDWLGILANDSRFREWALAERLLELAQTAGSDREIWARLALALAPLLDPLSPSATVLQDFRAAAHTALGDALRRQRELAAAERELVAAGRLLATAAESPERTIYCFQLAVLRRDQGLLDEAAALLERAAELAEDLGDTDRQAEILVELGGLYLDGLADSSRAVATFDSAWLLGLAGLPAALAFRIVRGLIRGLLAEGRSEEALDILAAARKKSPWPSPSVESLELQSLEGRILLARGDGGLGRRLLASVFAELCCRRAWLPAAIAGVAWARACLDEGDGGELAGVVRRIRRLTGEPDLDRRVRRALEVLVEDGERGALGQDFLGLLESYLDRAGEWPCPSLFVASDAEVAVLCSAGAP